VAAVPDCKLPKVSAAGSDIATLIQKHLPANYSDQHNFATLTECLPRNELDMIPEMLYAQSGLSLAEIRTATTQLPYIDKVQIFETHAAEATAQDCVWAKLRYTWDILSSYEILRTLQDILPPTNLQLQPLTPRFGYEVPQVIEDAGLADQFEECFDLSLQLNSALQAAGYESEAQYATLIGHPVRWRITLTGQDILRLKTATQNLPKNSETTTLINHIWNKIAEKHPLFAELNA
jgi:hypothetical protein